MIEVKANHIEAYHLLHRGTLALARAERQGIRIDTDYTKKTNKKLVKRIKKAEDKLIASKFYKNWRKSINNTPNYNSDPQLAKYLYSHLKIEPKVTTKTGKGSTSEDALLQLDIPELQLLLNIRKLKKIKDTYLAAFTREQIDGFLHPFFNLHIPVTYRSSSNKPNFQNIPNRDEEAKLLVKRAMFPRKGNRLMEADFKGLEVSIAACYHQDPTMLKYLNNPASDLHRDMAQQLFKLKKFDKNSKEHNTLRKATKNGFIFPQFYGDYYKNNAISLACEWGKLPEGKWKPGQGIKMPKGTLADHMLKKGITSLKDFTEHVRIIEQEFWNERFPVYARWKKDWFRAYQKTGSFNMFTGFTCSGAMHKNDVVNYPVQGAAFHCLLWSFIKLDELIIKKKWKTRLIGQIHDSIILDIYPPELERIKAAILQITTIDLSKHWLWINVPLGIEAELGAIDASWADLKEICLT